MSVIAPIEEAPQTPVPGEKVATSGRSKARKQYKTRSMGTLMATYRAGHLLIDLRPRELSLRATFPSDFRKKNNSQPKEKQQSTRWVLGVSVGFAENRKVGGSSPGKTSDEM